VSADWKSGDRALCVEPGSQPRYIGPRSTVGVVYLVESIFLSPDGQRVIFQPAGIDLGRTAKGVEG